MSIDDIIQLFLNNTASCVLTILAVLAVYYTRVLVKKFGNKLDAETQSKIQDIISSSVAQSCSYAEQWAKNIQKELGNNQKVSGYDKLLKALEYAVNDLKNHGLTNLNEQELKEKIESFLGIATLNINSMPSVEQIVGGEDNENSYFGN